MALLLTRNEQALASQRCYSNPQARPCSADEVIRQIGHMTLLAVSGGRWLRAYDSGTAQKDEVGVFLPCGSGRAVEVILNALDLYDVRRVRLIARGEHAGEVVVEHEALSVYCDELSEAVYQASCWK